MKSFGLESGGSWCFPSFIVVILLETVVFAMAGKLVSSQCDGIVYRTLIIYRF